MKIFITNLIFSYLYVNTNTVYNLGYNAAVAVKNKDVMNLYALWTEMGGTIHLISSKAIDVLSISNTGSQAVTIQAKTAPNGTVRWSGTQASNTRQDYVFSSVTTDIKSIAISCATNMGFQDIYLRTIS